jgi:hypothetical protein
VSILLLENSANAILTRARHARVARSLSSRSYVICGFKLFFSRLVSAELCSAAIWKKRASARFSLLCFTSGIEDKYFQFVKAGRRVRRSLKHSRDYLTCPNAERM